MKRKAFELEDEASSARIRCLRQWVQYVSLYSADFLLEMRKLYPHISSTAMLKLHIGPCEYGTMLIYDNDTVFMAIRHGSIVVYPSFHVHDHQDKSLWPWTAIDCKSDKYMPKDVFRVICSYMTMADILKMRLLSKTTCHWISDDNLCWGLHVKHLAERFPFIDMNCVPFWRTVRWLWIPEHIDIMRGLKCPILRQAVLLSWTPTFGRFVTEVIKPSSITIWELNKKTNKNIIKRSNKWFFSPTIPFNIEHFGRCQYVTFSMCNMSPVYKKWPNFCGLIRDGLGYLMTHAKPYSTDDDLWKKRSCCRWSQCSMENWLKSVNRK